jgi:methylmalonyl-CoA/ethylmalonyl-CoA epimerase
MHDAMQVLGIDRVLVATTDLDRSSERFADLLGLSFGTTIDPPDDPASNRMSPAGIEFVTADDSDSPVGRFLDDRGPGVYAVALEVADLEAACDHLGEHGVEPIGEMEMNEFKELFYHPSDFEGTLLVLTEYDHRHPAEIAARDGGDAS